MIKNIIDAEMDEYLLPYNFKNDLSQLVQNPANYNMYRFSKTSHAHGYRYKSVYNFSGIPENIIVYLYPAGINKDPMNEKIKIVKASIESNYIEKPYDEKLVIAVRAGTKFYTIDKWLSNNNLSIYGKIIITLLKI